MTIKYYIIFIRAYAYDLVLFRIITNLTLVHNLTQFEPMCFFIMFDVQERGVDSIGATPQWRNLRFA